MKDWQLKQRQCLPLEAKVIHSQNVIHDWYSHCGGEVYVSFSGGKDSTVLKHLVESLYPNIPSVFVNTGLEYPEIVDFVESQCNVVQVRPSKPFNKVVEEYGYPIISKQVSMGLDRHRNTRCELQKELRLHGGVNPSSGKKQQRTIPKKFHYLVDSGFKFSDRCCDVLKKSPLKRYQKETGRSPFVGTMASDSNMRKLQYLKRGCNSFSGSPQSNPLAIWTDRDVWKYIETRGVAYSSIYDKEGRTGCMFCMFGVHLESEPNRFQRMKTSHPKQYEYCINNLGLGRVLDILGVPYV